MREKKDLTDFLFLLVRFELGAGQGSNHDDGGKGHGPDAAPPFLLLGQGDLGCHLEPSFFFCHQ